MQARVAPWLLALALLGCFGGDEAKSGPVPPAPPPPAPPPGGPAVVVGPATRAEDDNPLGALKALGAAAQQMAQAAQAPGGAVVNFRELLPFAPRELAGFTAKGDVDGSTTSVPGMGSMEVTRVAQSYAAGEERMELEIVDTSLAPMLRAPYALAAMVREDSTDGYKKGANVKGQPGFVEWQKGQKKSQANLLVANRFIVNISVDTSTQGTAERVAEALDIPGLVAIAQRSVPKSP